MQARAWCGFLAGTGLALSGIACDSRHAAALPSEAPGERDDLDLAQQTGPGNDPLSLVCPGCLPRSGGETSDFGSYGACARFWRRSPVTDARARELGFDVDRLRALAERDFAAPFRWVLTVPIPGEFSNDPGKPPTGYSPETSVVVSTQIQGDLLYQALDAQMCDTQGWCSDGDSSSRPVQCADRLVFDIAFEIQTADGALAAAGTASSWTEKSFSSLSAVGNMDLSPVQGTLRLEPTREGPYHGVLNTVFYFHPEGVRGSLHPYLEAPALPEQRLDPTYFWQSSPLFGGWPIDECPVNLLPIESATPEASAALGAFEQRFASERAAFNAASPFTAEWRAIDGFDLSASAGGEPTSLSVEVDDAARPLCLTSNSVTFEARVRVTTADGRVDWTESMEGELPTGAPRTDPYGLPVTRSFVVGWLEDVPAADPLWQRGLPGIDLLGGLVGRVQFNASVDNGDLSVFTVPPCGANPHCDEDGFDRRGLSTVVRLSWPPLLQP